MAVADNTTEACGCRFVFVTPTIACSASERKEVNITALGQCHIATELNNHNTDIKQSEPEFQQVRNLFPKEEFRNT
ncbi:hypothetical protein SS1G_01673 [Sclerotinia sclerotiorum 1980 UF-70]|uniref:Uncharacterized protein n=1 Tax=Sclerotinia sclerotiorum (strain ATCC 18683 / 1980 / Ss-1) TaxID=665079 RepID=A7E8P5_SCLS1|nr:hypothetical protein SS1G_01673 [Sclerotinia sclerotiorum 1980 UF-70]EDN96747.1 hypothetical protein SS1G_01673 [Sclerotinia sclerotiorum 1980 UF-70]